MFGVCPTALADEAPALAPPFSAPPLPASPLSAPPLLSIPTESPVASSAANPAQVGMIAPVLSLLDPEGGSRKLSEWVAQKPVVLVISGAKSRLNLAKAGPIAQAAGAFDKKGGAVLGLLPPGKTPKTFGANAPLLLLRDNGAAAKAFGVEPKSVVVAGIDRAGWVRGLLVLQEKKQQNAGFVAGQINQMAAQLGGSVASGQVAPLEEGKPAPDFAMRDMNGLPLRLSDLKGRQNLLLTFFPKCFTGGCATHLSSLRDAFQEIAATNTQIWAVSVDPAEGERGQIAFAKKLSLPFPLLPDEGRNLSLLYGAAISVDQKSARMSILVDKTGTVRWIDDEIVVRSHGEDALNKIRELGLDK